MILPNVLIAGAPKCGTGSVFSWLANHPKVCTSHVKETFFLMDNGHPLLNKSCNYHEHGLDGYQTFFSHCDPDCDVILEATTHYIYQQTALDVLSSLNPVPQVIFILRKPSDRVYSSFQYTKNNLANLDKTISFRQFTDIIKSERAEPLINRLARDSAYVLRNDIKYSRYIDYIPAWVSRFGKERVHVFLFEDMKRDPRTFMRNLSKRIGIDPGFYEDYDFIPYNETFYIKNQVLHRWIREIAKLIPQSVFKGLMKKIYLGIQADKPELTLEDSMTLSGLECEFRPFNQRLAQELGIDITVWD